MEYQIRHFRDENIFLSNFYDAPVLYNGLKYKNAESAYQAQKCPERAGEFCGLSGKEAKSLGKRMPLREDWNDIKYNIMYEIVKAKFTQNIDLKVKLIATKNFALIEGNTWGDTYWGVDLKTNRGENKLGEILMKIRSELQPGNIKIGITEQGDAGIDFGWYDAVKNDEVNGAILITKNITPRFRELVLELHRDYKNIIVMATCTGFGGTIIEPNVPPYKKQLDSLKELIDKGFPASLCVLRIDPIIPTKKGIQRVREVVEYANKLGILRQMRIRISILDEYPHVKERFHQAGIPSVYKNSNAANFDEIVRTALALHNLHDEYGIKFFCCAEPRLIKHLTTLYGEDQNICIAKGCISADDLLILGLPKTKALENMQGREGCHCLSCKTELLHNKTRCPNGCLYCYWKD